MKTVPAQRRQVNKQKRVERHLSSGGNFHLLSHPFVMKNRNKLLLCLRMKVHQEHQHLRMIRLYVLEIIMCVLVHTSI